MFIEIAIGIIIVGLISYIWSFAMTPAKCKIAHKEIMDDIREEFVKHREQMKEYIDMAIENKILKELRKTNGTKP